ncbi:hypothetical protein ATO12_08575 [Aquimarina atlantica]|uniref:CARDB domain-containing protein n=2 Tax=Aquimarina atlantica TaxID=1317122 RepID=A0A023BXQ8_9FLAO|nr:hypothetical protein ATO12_08575 [Aquimarina atlantica]
MISSVIRANTDRGYETKRLGATLSEAVNVYCSGNTNVSNLRTIRFNVVGSSTALLVGKIYKLNDSGDIDYFLITKISSYNDERDAYGFNDFTLINDICNNPYGKRHDYKNLGTTFSEAAQNLCKTNNHQSLPILSTNIHMQGKLNKGGIYIRKDGNKINYMLITKTYNTTAADRDTYDRSLFSDNPIQVCPGQYDKQHKVRYLGNTEAKALSTLCSNEFHNLPIFRFNVDSFEPLSKNKVYRRELDGKIDYLYIVDTRNTPEIDRDTYPRDIFSTNPVNIFCDDDSDGIANEIDNCPTNYNPDQANNDGDSKGNVCDNCPNNSNSDQADLDGDGVGDVCDTDRDGDSISNSNDNCPNKYNPNQLDTDNDGIGDVCDPIDNNAKYDLRLTESNTIVTSTCSSCPSQLNLLNPGFAGGTFPFRKHFLNFTQGGASGSVNMIFTIENIGNAPSEAVDVNFYLSQGYNSTQGLKANNKTVTIPSLQANQTYVVKANVNYDDFRAAQGQYYIVIDVEPGGGDKNRSNNFVNIPTYVRCITCSKLKDFLQSDSEVEKPYTIAIYDIYGNLQSSHTVRNETEEKEIIKQLPKGFYIIKNGTKTYKVGK